MTVVAIASDQPLMIGAVSAALPPGCTARAVGSVLGGTAAADRAAFDAVDAVIVDGVRAPGVALAQDEPSPPPSDTVVIEGREYGPEDGLVIDEQEVEIVPGGEPVEVNLGNPREPAQWGSSYATSTETAFIFYTGKAKAAANVFEGRRIISVSIQYNRLRSAGGPDEVVGPRRTSFATCPASNFRPGPEVTTSATDSLGLSDPRTRFIIGTGRVAPTQRCG